MGRKGKSSHLNVCLVKSDLVSVSLLRQVSYCSKCLHKLHQTVRDLFFVRAVGMTWQSPSGLLYYKTIQLYRVFQSGK